MSAILQMAEALSCIKQKTEFKVSQYKKISEANKEVIKEILGTKTLNELNDQTKIWQEHIPHIILKDEKLTVPDDYNPDKWLNDMKASADKKSTDYYEFNVAAVKHLEFVKKALSLNRIFLDDIPAGRIFSFNIRNNAGNYISQGKTSWVPGLSGFYPTVSAKDKVTLEFIMPNDKNEQLLCGTVFKIRTTENAAGTLRYLGAWSTPSLYYYTKDWNIYKQKWTIEQPGKSSGDVVDLLSPLYIKNMHYDKSPYLCLKSDNYLTTGSSKYDWHLESMYVTDLKVIYGKNTSTPVGYVKIPKDLSDKAGEGSEYIYLCYKLGSNKEDAITNIFITSDKDEIKSKQQKPQGYTIIEDDLNKVAGQGSEYIYLCYKKDVNNVPITDLAILFNDERADNNYIKITNDLNKGSGKGSTYVYLAVKHAQSHCVTDIKILYGRDALAPADYYILPQDLNDKAGEGSEYIYLCYKFGSNKEAAITNIFIASDKDETRAKQQKPEGYVILENDLNNNAGQGSDYIFLCYKKDANNVPITDLMILFNEDKVERNFIKITNDLNKGSGEGSTYAYLAVRHMQPYYISDIQIIYGKDASL